MKATLEFNLPEDREDHIMALRGHEAFIALGEIVEKFRTLDKYENELVTDEKISISVVRDEIHGIISERNLWIDGVL